MFVAYKCLLTCIEAGEDLDLFYDLVKRQTLTFDDFSECLVTAVRCNRLVIGKVLIKMIDAYPEEREKVPELISNIVRTGNGYSFYRYIDPYLTKDHLNLCVELNSGMNYKKLRRLFDRGADNFGTGLKQCPTVDDIKKFIEYTASKGFRFSEREICDACLRHCHDPTPEVIQYYVEELNVDPKWILRQGKFWQPVEKYLKDRIMVEPSCAVL